MGALTDSAAAAAPLAQPHSFREDATVMGLVGWAHGASHFFHLLLPPLFPLYATTFGVSYAELGLLVTLFFIVSGVGQALSGFVVDRVGGWPVLMLSMALFFLAAVVAATAQGYSGLAVAAVLAGLGNAPMHPADFTLLNQRVHPSRLGPAFSVHGLSGNLGWALAPALLVGLTSATGSWRWAMAGAAAVALLTLIALAMNRTRLHGAVTVSRLVPASGSPAEPVSSRPPNAAPAPNAAAGSLAFLRLPQVWWCFAFFFWSTCALTMVQSVAAPALEQGFGMPVERATLVVTAYMLCSAVGMALGGLAAQRMSDGPWGLDRWIGVCLAISAGLMLLVASGWVGASAAFALVAVTGLAIGLAGPSRDLLIRRAAPPGATGRVYGTVYSGLDIGFAAAAPVFGWLLDHGRISALFLGAAACLVLSLFAALAVGRRVRA